jgi:predicted ATPase/class 3 adenylate cyclase
MEKNSFGNWLRLKRKSLDLTREQLAERLGYSAATIRKIEDEERRPSAQVAERLAELFDIPAQERTAFLKFARGDWQAAPTENIETTPWMAPTPYANDPQTGSQTHLATFLFTDIENSAKLWERVPEKMKVALARHHAILQDAIVSRGGTVFQIVGDAFCVAFPTVLSAISAAVAAQQELQQQEWDLPFPIRVRMGIHTGEAERTAKGEYVSNPTLNRVARIVSAAHGGQILLSLATKDLIKDSLPDDTELRDMGEHYLKNMMHPERLFQLNIAGLPSEFPPLNTLTHRHNLPIQLSSFIARQDEIAAIHQYLSRDDIRLVTLMGPPGIGKTRLSIEVARAALADFPDGVFFVALAPLDNPALIALTVAQALGYVETGTMSTEQQLRESIGEKQMLIVLDNCEHLIEAASSLTSQLLSACSHLKIMTTSRESLRIPGEWLYPVPAFQVPPETSSIDVESTPSLPALALFAERARAVRPDFMIDADNIADVSKICARLDGLPLAIELMAARMRLMSPDVLLARMNNQYVLSADGMRAPSARQKTLQNAIDWSYGLLSQEEQNLFTYLSIFTGGFTLEAAEAMFSPLFTNKNVPELITSLLDKSLLQYGSTGRSEQTSSRYTMLVTIQEFARNRLQQTGEATDIHNRHLAHFLALAEEADQHIHGPAQLVWMDRLNIELDNFRAALDWGRSSQQTEKLLRLFEALGWNWLVRWSYREYRNWLDTIRALPDINDHPATYAQILNTAARAEWVAANLGEARTFVNESRKIWQELGKAGERGLAEGYYLSGMIAMQEGDYDEALPYYEQSLELYQKCGEPWGVAMAKFLLGNVTTWKDDHSAAMLWLTQSHDLFAELGDLWGIARVSQRLGELFLKQGNYENARLYFDQHLTIDEGLHFTQGTVVALINLGDLYRHQRDYDQAEGCFAKSLALSREYNLNIDRGFSIYCLGMLALQRSQYRLAKQFFVDYFHITRTLTEKISTCDLLMGAAAVAAGTDQPERAAKLYGAAQALLETTDYRIPPFDRAEFDRHTQIARLQLGEVKFEVLVTEGRAMTIEQAIAYALEPMK